MIRRFVVGVVGSLLVLLAVGNAWGGIQYTITDLGTLPGYVSSYARGLNDNGQVVGYAYTSSSIPRAFLYSSGTMT